MDSNLKTLRRQVCDNRLKLRDCTHNFMEAVKPCFAENEITAYYQRRALFFDSICDEEYFALVDKVIDGNAECEEMDSIKSTILSARKLLEDFVSNIGPKVIQSYVDIVDSVIKFMIDKEDCKLYKKLTALVDATDFTRCQDFGRIFGRVIENYKTFCSESGYSAYAHNEV